MMRFRMESAATTVEPLWQRLQRLREQRGLSRSLLSRHSARFGDEGVSEETIKRLELPPENRHHRRASAEVIEKLARALDVPPDEFPEYELARERAKLDEREVPLSEAVEQLRLLQDVLKVAHHGSGHVTVDNALAIPLFLEGGEAVLGDAAAAAMAPLDRETFVLALRSLLERVDPSVDIAGAVEEAATPTQTAAAARYRAFLREAAQRTREHREELPGTRGEQDARETGG